MAVVTVPSNKKRSFLSKEVLSPFSSYVKHASTSTFRDSGAFLRPWKCTTNDERMNQNDRWIYGSFSLSATANYVIYSPISADSLVRELAFYSRDVTGRFQILSQERSRKKSCELVFICTTLDLRLNGVDMKHVTLYCSSNNCLKPPRF